MINSMMQKQYQNAFTLIELVLYTALLSLVFGLLVFFINMTLQSRAKQIRVAEVEYAGMFILTQVTNSIRSAHSVESPSVGSSGTLLQLHRDGVTDTFYSIEGGRLLLSDVNHVSVPLHSDLISISGGDFEIVSGDPHGRKTVHIRLTIGTNSLNQHQEFRYEKKFITTVQLGI